MDVRDWIDETGTRRAFETVGTGVTVHDSTGRLVYINRAGLDLLGWTTVQELSLEEMLSSLDIQAPNGFPVTLAELPVSQALAGRDPVDTELSVRVSSGTRRSLRTIARRVVDGHERLTAVVVTFIDQGETASARNTTHDAVEPSTPVLTVGHKLLLQPLIGTLDSKRAAQAMEKLLETIGNTGSKVAIVDITGVSAVDAATANHLLRSLAAARLLGCEVVLSGVSPPIARTITLLGLDLSALRTKRDVAAAIEFGRRWVEATETPPARNTPAAHHTEPSDTTTAEKSPTMNGAN